MHIASTGSSFNFSSQFLSSYGSDFIRFILNWISPIQKCVSLGPEEAILKAKVLFTNCLLLDETGLRAKHHLQKGVLGIWKSSRNCNKLDPAKYLHPESHEFEFPAPGDYEELDRRTVRWRGTLTKSPEIKVRCKTREIWFFPKYLSFTSISVFTSIFVSFSQFLQHTAWFCFQFVRVRRWLVQ